MLFTLCRKMQEKITIIENEVRRYAAAQHCKRDRCVFDSHSGNELFSFSYSGN